MVDQSKAVGVFFRSKHFIHNFSRRRLSFLDFAENIKCTYYTIYLEEDEIEMEGEKHQSSHKP